MSFPKTMTTEQLQEYGFVIDPDNEARAYSELYPDLSCRHRCETCGMWSSVMGGEKLECPQCHQRKPPLRETKQYFKLYACCQDDGCQVRHQAIQILRRVGIDTNWPSHDGFGEYWSLYAVKELSDPERSEFFEVVNNLSVSKFGARKLCHPNSKARSKLPKRPSAPQ